MPSPTTYASTVNLWIASFFQDFADRFMQPEYRSSALNLANCRVSEVYAYNDYWAASSIPLEHGAFCYFLTYTMPYSFQLNVLHQGDVVTRAYWVVLNYNRFKPVLDYYSQSLIPPVTVEECCPDIETTKVATDPGAQSMYLGTGVTQFDLYINGLKQEESGLTYIGSNLEIDGSYNIRVGDHIKVVYRG